MKQNQGRERIDPIQLAEYAVQNKMSEEPAFAWWTKHMLKKRDRIISKTASRYWQKTHGGGTPSYKK